MTVADYLETYAYDLVGNFASMTHKSGNTTSWTRSYACVSGSNRLASTTVGNTTLNYTHDAAGNMTVMPHLPAMDWDEKEQLVHCTKGVGNTTEIYFVYDASGQRVRKLVYSVTNNGQTGTLQNERVYVGGEHGFFKDYSANLERETTHVMDGQRRVAIVEQLTMSGGLAVLGSAQSKTLTKVR